MDFGYLLGILARRKWLILSAMLAAAVVTFIFIGRRAERYKSTAILATGIVNYKGINSDKSDAFVQQFQIENAFSNLMEFSQSRSTIKLLSIDMLRHDLGAYLSGKEKPYRNPNPGLIKMSQDELNTSTRELYQELEKVNLDSITDPSFSQHFDYLLDRVSRVFGYDHDAILRGIAVKRKGETDYLSIEMTTEKPVLSQSMANTYVKRFMTYYQNLALKEKRRNLENFTKLAEEKRSVYDSVTILLFKHLKSKGLAAPQSQNEELIAEIGKLEIEQQHAQAKKSSSAASVKQLDRYIGDKRSTDAFDTRERVVNKNNTDEVYQKVRELTQKSLETGGKDPDIESELTQAKADLEKSVVTSARTLGKSRTDDSKRTKEDLFKEKVSSDLEGIEAKESADRIGTEIRTLKGKLGSMVGNDEISKKLEANANLAEAEFTKANDNRIAAKMNLEKAENPLSIVENAQLPEWPESNHKTLISVFAAIVVGTITCIALFVLAYMDSSLQTPDLFKKYTDGLPLLGTVVTVPVRGLDFNQVFSSNGKMPQFTLFREGMRRIRSQLILSKSKVFLLVSTKSHEGKTFTMFALAHSLAANNKKVLMLDTNFKTPIPESHVDQPTANSNLINKSLKDNGLAEIFLLKKSLSQTNGAEENLVDIIGNTGLHRSPSELLEPDSFKAFLASMLEHYDYILMESAALNHYSDAQELLPFAEKVIAVFNAHSVIRPADKESLQFLRDLKEKFAGSVLTATNVKNAS
jgi:uncharacterized protein involved in exopolysaccharide biosynthesis/Mrp family chromosome partitioning ATPase